MSDREMSRHLTVCTLSISLHQKIQHSSQFCVFLLGCSQAFSLFSDLVFESFMAGVEKRDLFLVFFYSFFFVGQLARQKRHLIGITTIEREVTSAVKLGTASFVLREEVARQW